jgi:extracellular elastinolytic metalloproteinase
MSRETDLRDFSVDKSELRQAELENAASEISENLPGDHRIRIESFDAATGNPAVVASESAPQEEGNYVQRALDHVQAISGALGLVATQPTEFTPDPNFQETSSGAKAVHLQQQYKGIPIFQAAQTVRFAPDDRLAETVGSSVTIAQEKVVSSSLSVEQAVLKAAQHVAVPDQHEREATDQFGEPLSPVSVDVSGFVPKVIATFPDKAEQPTVLEPGPFGDRIKASLIWFVPNENEPQLAWEVILTMPNYEGQYRTMVDAETGEILYSHQLMRFIAARGNVFRLDGSGARQMTPFPRPLEDYGLPIPNVCHAASQTIGLRRTERLETVYEPTWTIAARPSKASSEMAYSPSTRPTRRATNRRSSTSSTTTATCTTTSTCSALGRPMGTSSETTSTEAGSQAIMWMHAPFLCL